VIDSEMVLDARRDLGRQLAARREAAGLTQQDLALLIHYGRSTIANVETGRQTCSRMFWERCDAAVEADNILIRAYEDLKELVREQHAGVARRLQQESPANARQVAVPEMQVQDATPSAGLPRVGQVTFTSPAHLDEILMHLREQWHSLVRTDNLLGPRFALAGVLSQLSIVDELLPVVRGDRRLDLVRLGAQYAESAAWLYEGAGNLVQGRYWTGQAMDWAYEAGDSTMLAWTMFRRSQQAAVTQDAAQVIGLALAARREEAQLASPMRAAIRVQEAYGHALDGNARVSQQLLDEAHTWASADNTGDARGGHGSYCTPSYIELQRAHCCLTFGEPRKSIQIYEQALPTLPVVYQRDRATALSRLAAAYLADGQPDRAAITACAALPVSRGTGSDRVVMDIKGLGAKLAPHRSMPAVAALLDDLDDGEA
jgi:transcriptional regulator with XRE-family HTH domain